MTTKDTDTHNSPPATEPLALRLSEGLGPLVEYRIKSSGLGPATYGNCERCGKQCPCHYMQQYRKQGQIRRGWASAGFGHVECLRTGPWVNAPVTHDARA